MREIVQIPGGVDDRVLLSLAYHATGVGAELGDDLVVGHGVLRAALGMVHGLGERAAVGRGDGGDRPFDAGKERVDLGVGYHLDLGQQHADARIEELFLFKRGGPKPAIGRGRCDAVGEAVIGRLLGLRVVLAGVVRGCRRRGWWSGCGSLPGPPPPDRGFA